MELHAQHSGRQCHHYTSQCHHYTMGIERVRRNCQWSDWIRTGMSYPMTRPSRPGSGWGATSSRPGARRPDPGGPRRRGRIGAGPRGQDRARSAGHADDVAGDRGRAGLAHRPVLGPPEPLGHRAARERGKPAAGPGGGAALRAEPRLDAEGQELFATAYEGFASPPSVPDVLAVLTADRRLDEAGRALLVAWSPTRTGTPPTRSPSSWWTPNRASRRAFSSPKHKRSHDDRQTDVRTHDDGLTDVRTARTRDDAHFKLRVADRRAIRIALSTFIAVQSHPQLHDTAGRPLGGRSR